MVMKVSMKGFDCSLAVAAQFNIHIQIVPLPDRSVHVVDVTDY